jgi:glycosyltransferase involved in cell wall biosynthesis
MDQADEIIVTEDGGMFSNNILQLADSYLFNKNNAGFTRNVNRGWKYASGDFVAIINSDTQLKSGNLRDLCIPGKVTSPEIVNQYIERLAGPFFVVPKEIAKERGYLLEELKTYSSDSEYDHRVKDIFVKVPSVQIYHEQAQTVKVAGVEGGVEQERDRKIYEQLIREGRAAA